MKSDLPIPNNKKTTLKLILFSVSIFILSATIFSRLIILGVKNKSSREIKIDTNTQVLSYEDQSQDTDVKKLPNIFPADIPVYPGAVLDDFWVSESEKVTGISVVWGVKDDLDSVVQFYKNEFSAIDWNAKTILDDESSLTMSFDKEYYDGFVGITKDDQGVVISLTVGIRNGNL